MSWPTTGWIPPSQRDDAQKRLTAEFHERIGLFRHRAARLGAQPERVLMHEAEIEATGKLLPRVKQLTGSCVGAGAARARSLAVCGDIVARGSRESAKLSFPFISYGIGRRIAGMGGRGDGSFGAAQAEAEAKFGTLPIDHPKMQAPTHRNGWVFWSERLEYDWSWPSKWPIPERELAEECSKYVTESVSQLDSVDDLKEALAQKRGCTIACGYIPTNRPEVKGDLLIDAFTGRGGHQQCVSAYWDHPTLGLHFAIDNQWDDVHGHCPTLYPLGVTGTYWVAASRIDKIFKSGDSEFYAFSSTGDFSLDPIDHGDLGIR